MNKIEKKSYGYKLTLGGTILMEEMQKWVEDSKNALASQSGKFGVIIDMRTLAMLKSDVQATMVEGQKHYKQKGMDKSAVILANAMVTMQFKLLAQKSGIYATERYIDASADANWEKTAEAWITSGTDPDKK